LHKIFISTTQGLTEAPQKEIGSKWHWKHSKQIQN